MNAMPYFVFTIQRPKTSRPGWFVFILGTVRQCERINYGFDLDRDSCIWKSCRGMNESSATGETATDSTRTASNTGLMVTVIAIGSLLRFIWFDLMELKFDEVEMLRLTRQWLETGIPQYGMMSGVGVRNPPGFVFILLPVMAVTASPLLAGLWVALMNIAAIALMAILGRVLGMPRAGVYAAMFMAAHPWLVLFSRKIWAQSVLPLVVTLLLVVMCTCMRNARSRAVFWAPLLACLAWQIHYSAYAVVALLFLWLCNELRLRRLNVRMLLLGVLAAAIALAPYLHYLMGPGIGDLEGTLGVGAERFNINLVIRIFATWAKTAFAGGLGNPFTFEMTPIWGVIEGPVGFLLHAVAVIATLMVLTLAAGAWPRRGEKTIVSGASWWLILFVAMPIALYLVKRVSTPPHYYIVSLPALLMLAGIGLDRAASRAQARAWPAARTSLLFIVVTGVVIVMTILVQVKRTGGTSGDYGGTYRAQRDAATLLLESKVAPRYVDARFTRDEGIGVLYLMVTESSGVSFSPDRRAQIVDTLLLPDHGCSGTGKMLLNRREGPLDICVFESVDDET